MLGKILITIAGAISLFVFALVGILNHGFPPGAVVEKSIAVASLGIAAFLFTFVVVGLVQEKRRNVGGSKAGLLLLILFAVPILPGCSVFQETSEKAAEKIGEGVVYYCDNFAVEIRDEFRTMVNKHSAPNTVTVTCANDGEVLTTQ